MSDDVDDLLTMAPTLEDFQHWTDVLGRAQQLLMEFALSPEGHDIGRAMVSQLMDPRIWSKAVSEPSVHAMTSPPHLASIASLGSNWLSATTSFWQENMALWQGFATGQRPDPSPEKDRRFAAPEWQAHPLFAFIRQSYALIAERLIASADAVDGIDPHEKAQLRFATAGLVDALAPSNFALTNPTVLKRTMETRGENLIRGLEHMLNDLKRGQMTHVDTSRFELGVNIATTPGKVVHETPLYQLIHYTPTTIQVFETPLVIFPPWINRYYILDLNAEKSFIAWCVEQGISTFIVSWKSADESMADVVWDDYIAAQIDAIATIRDMLSVASVHAIGYCVAGTTLAATLSLLAAHGEADVVKSATFFTAQVDFSEAGDLSLMVDDQHLAMIEELSSGGYLDGRYMAATFNALRSRDLIWNYVINNYLMGDDYPPFDLLYWNGDTTNLPAKWHQSYLRDLYRDNRLVVPGSLSAEGTPIDLTRITTPAYIQAGREDHIAPANSVWKIMHHLAGPKRFVLAGSGHIAGVVNPPSAGKYQHWINDAPTSSTPDTLDAFIAGAREVKGSWWPDWLAWLSAQGAAKVAAKGARIPGKGKSVAIEDAPGRYVRMR
ncbi:MAG: class I poly(R)-hydroxyalkanoic acid synthase [Sphingopyxis sp.]